MERLCFKILKGPMPYHVKVYWNAYALILCDGSVTLNNIIQKNFPEEYAERKSEQDTLVHLGNESMPLFVMDVIIPCQKLSLHIFEPRYRLMVSSFVVFHGSVHFKTPLARFHKILK